MHFHNHLYQLNHLRRKMGISESLNAIGANLTILDKGRRNLPECWCGP